MTTGLNIDIERIVRATVQKYLGTSAPLPVGSRLSEDLGIDSLAFVTILMELADQLRLDLTAVEINLKEIDTLQDIVELVMALVAAKTARQ